MGPIESLSSAISHHVQTIHRAATSCAAGGGPEWDGLLRHYGLVPLDGNERAFIVTHMRLSRGAVPAEVRSAFMGLQKWAHGEIDRLRNAGHATPPDLHQRISALVDHETSTYERSIGVAPPPPPAAAPAPPPAYAPPPGTPSLGSIFANAHSTAKEVPWANQKYSAVANLNCVHCGGPQEQPADFMCRYCRRPIAGAIKPTA
jgi:hypothetical protein